MHTASQLAGEMFSIEVTGWSARREDVLDWGERDRMGVVVTAPYGGLGAGLLLSLAITAFYDAPGRGRRSLPLYPDNYVFHVGGPWGSYSYFDLWPQYKEVFATNEKAQILAAINRYGITHLVVPTGLGDSCDYQRDEYEAACDRIKQAFVYSPNGRVPGADIMISASHPNVLSNFEFTLRPSFALEDAESHAARLDPRTAEAKDARIYIELARSRLDEVPESSAATQEGLLRLAGARNGRGWREELRRASARDALKLLT